MVILGRDKPVVLCAVDWIGIGNGGQTLFRERLAAAAGTTPDRVALAPGVAAGGPPASPSGGERWAAGSSHWVTLLLEGERATLRVAPDGCLWLTRRGEAERPLPFDPPAAGYKGDSVYATQAHLIGCLRTGRPSESDGRDYLKTVALVEACYRSAATGARARPEF